MTARPRVVVTRRLPEDVERALVERYDVVLSTADAPMSSEALQRALGEGDALLCTVTDRITAEVLAAYPIRTRIIANFGVGMDNIDLAAAAAHEIVVTNTPDVLTDDTADLAMMLILMTLRRAGEGERLVRAGAWTGWAPTHHLGRRVTGATLAVLGFGRIGRALARRAHHGFGMRVVAWSRSRPARDVLEATGASFEPSIHAALAAADVVSLHVPSTAETRHLLGASEIAALRRGSVVINTARGDVVDEAALREALRDGHLGGVGLDVYQGEPHVDPAWMPLERAVLLPHLGSATVETRTAMGLRALANLDAFFAGGTVPDRVV